jgi:hypothetical protein
MFRMISVIIYVGFIWWWEQKTATKYFLKYEMEILRIDLLPLFLFSIVFRSDMEQEMNTFMCMPQLVFNGVLEGNSDSVEAFRMSHTHFFLVTSFLWAHKWEEIARGFIIEI